MLLVSAVGAGCEPTISVGPGDGGGGGGGGGQPGCVPEPEICDGLDNDCDGQVDDLPAAGACDTGLPGICGLGVEHCNAGVAVCVASAEPSSEACDGLDNDCNGLTDDVVAGTECDTGLPGVCAAGSAQCVAGSWVCTPWHRSRRPMSCATGWTTTATAWWTRTAAASPAMPPHVTPGLLIQLT